MEDLMELIKTRRSIRRFKPDTVPLDEIKKTIEAARWAPSAGNSQPWQFIVVTNKTVIDSIKMFSPGMVFDKPPAMVILCHNEKRLITNQSPVHFIDLGTSLQNLLLMAHTIGLGCTPIYSFDKDAVITLLNLPINIRPVLLITMGYPDEKHGLRKRIQLEKLIEAIIE